MLARTRRCDVGYLEGGRNGVRRRTGNRAEDIEYLRAQQLRSRTSEMRPIGNEKFEETRQDGGTRQTRRPTTSVSGHWSFVRQILWKPPMAQPVSLKNHRDSWCALSQYPISAHSSRTQEQEAGMSYVLHSIGVLVKSRTSA